MMLPDHEKRPLLVVTTVNLSGKSCLSERILLLVRLGVCDDMKIVI